MLYKILAEMWITLRCALSDMQQSLYDGLFDMGHSGMWTYVKCAEVMWFTKSGDVVHFFFHDSRKACEV